MFAACQLRADGTLPGVQQPRGAKVADPDIPGAAVERREEDVGRLQISVYNAVSVEVMGGASYACHPAQD